MKIIQTFWTGNKKIESPLKISAGWASPEFHWMSWALSCLLLKNQYEQIELYTDEVGKKILIEILQLPYTKVHVVFDQTFTAHPKLFSLAKIRTYSLQEEPFIHIDGDVYLWKRFNDTILNADIVASNLEKNLFFNQDILEEVEKNFFHIPKHLKGVLKQKDIFASNAGIFGGSNLDFIKKYSDEAFKFINSNSNKLELVNTGGLNFLIEQISLFYLIKEDNIPVKYYIKSPVGHPLYQDYLRFIDVPDVKMVHPVGGCKRIPYVLNHLSKRLRLEFPDYYYKILKLSAFHDIPLKMKLYNYIDFDSIKKGKSSFKNLNILNSELKVKNDFQTWHQRTNKALKYFASNKINSKQEFLNQLHGENNLYKLLELYDLENANRKMFGKLIAETKKSDLYEKNLNGYKKSSKFYFNSNWMEQVLIYDENILCIDLNWNWKLFVENPTLESLKTILKSEKSTYLVTLSFDILNLEIHETFHEGIDAVVLKHISPGKSIKSLMTEIIKHFEEDISIGNKQYQRLIFDIIKRLLFTNIIRN